MPCQDKPTAIRTPNDLDLELALEAAWTRIELEGWPATPELLFALEAEHKERLTKRYGGKLDDEDLAHG